MESKRLVVDLLHEAFGLPESVWKGRSITDRKPEFDLIERELLEQQQIEAWKQQGVFVRRGFRRKSDTHVELELTVTNGVTHHLVASCDRNDVSTFVKVLLDNEDLNQPMMKLENFRGILVDLVEQSKKSQKDERERLTILSDIEGTNARRLKASLQKD